MTNAAFNQVLFDEAVDAMPQDVLSGLRKSAAAKFRQTGFPTTRHEDWHYTNLASVVTMSDAWLLNANTTADFSNDSAANIIAAIDAYWVQFRNGKIDYDASSIPDGVTVTRLTENDATWSIGRVSIDDPLTQLNAALLPDGVRVSVAASATVEKPVGFIIDDHANDQTVIAQTRILIEVGEGAKVQFIEAHASSGKGEHFANNVIQVDMARNSSADYLRMQERARHHIVTGRLSADLAENSKLEHFAFDLGGSLVRNDVVARLNGRDSNVSLYGLYLAGDKQHIDNHTRVDHIVGPARSWEEYRGILNHKSRCVFNGKAIVHKGADGTDANQSNHNLLLSGDAEIDTKPELEIYADDVKCSHGATVGQLDDAALFYLRSRGLDQATATRLITRAFAAKILSMLTIGAAGDYLTAAIDNRLDTLIGGNNDE